MTTKSYNRHVQNAPEILLLVEERVQVILQKGQLMREASPHQQESG